MNLIRRLFSQVDIASIVFFRISFGLILLWEAYRYISKGWVERLFIEPTFYFSYYGFGWVTPWVGDGMHYHFIVLGVLSFFVMIGFLYRISATLLFLGYAYVFLLDQSNYLNHIYLVCIIAFLMIFIPAHRFFSVDAALFPKIRSETAPAWALWLLRFQVGVPYFFGGIAKINTDWLAGKPFDLWLGKGADLPHVGYIFAHQYLYYFFSYSGLLFDLFIVPLLLWKRTRIFAFLFAILFHLTNSFLFPIGIFPWFMMLATTIYFNPDFPKRIFEYPIVEIEQKKSFDYDFKKKVLVGCLGVFVAFQILMPFRHFFYPGVVHWTEEGHNYSWHMKLRYKVGEARFLVVDKKTGVKKWIDPESVLNRKQYRKMATSPAMILAFAHHLAKEGDVEVYADVKAKLNGRSAQRLIDPNVNLAEVEHSIMPAEWILPLR
ncbi:MAG: HTTM domain-containing protein [Acidobacteriota bacterium]|jgi:hypothetical protein|nr:HTTM domain-containing protein [Acidobacteriota bacterium]